MNVSFACVVIASFWMVLVKAAEYSNRFDNVDIDEILQSDRLLSNYYKCLLDSGPCTPYGNQIRKYVPDALQNHCKECSDKHKKLGKKILKFFIENRPDMYKELEDKFDPTGDYKKSYHAELEKEGIKV